MAEGKYLYTTTHAGKTETRRSDRVYQFAVWVKSASRGGWGAWSYCGTRALAERQARQFQGWGHPEVAVEPVQVSDGHSRSRAGGYHSHPAHPYSHPKATHHRRVSGRRRDQAKQPAPAPKKAAPAPEPFDWDEAPGGLQAAAFPELRAPRPAAKPGVQMALYRRRRGR